MGRVIPCRYDAGMAETHSYYDWQVSTLMLAYDAADPLDRNATEALSRRQQKVENEIHQLAHQILPDEYKQNPQLEFPPEVVVLLTKGTLLRASEIAGLVQFVEDDGDTD